MTSFLGPALGRSLKLAAVAFVLVVPLSIVGVVVAAMNRGRAVDRIISVVGLSLSTVPEFVSGMVLIVVLAIGLKVSAPAAAATPLEHTPTLRDPGAAGLLPPAAGAAAGAIDYSAGAVRRERLRQLIRSPAFFIGASVLARRPSDLQHAAVSTWRHSAVGTGSRAGTSVLPLLGIGASKLAVNLPSGICQASELSLNWMGHQLACSPSRRSSQAKLRGDLNRFVFLLAATASRSSDRDDESPGQPSGTELGIAWLRGGLG